MVILGRRKIDLTGGPKAPGRVRRYLNLNLINCTTQSRRQFPIGGEINTIQGPKPRRRRQQDGQYPQVRYAARTPHDLILTRFRSQNPQDL